MVAVLCVWSVKIVSVLPVQAVVKVSHCNSGPLLERPSEQFYLSLQCYQASLLSFSTIKCIFPNDMGIFHILNLHTKSQTWCQKLNPRLERFSKFARITRTKTLNLLLSVKNMISLHVTEIEWSDINHKKATYWFQYFSGSDTANFVIQAIIMKSTTMLKTDVVSKMCWSQA